MEEIQKLKTGIPELDVVLRGGLPLNRLHLIEGKPGTGKTTIALRFLIEGAKQDDKCLYIALSETERELRATAASHNWRLDGIDICEIVPVEANLDDQQSVLFPSEVELGKTIRLITDCIEKHNPARIVIDSVSEIRLLAEDPMAYRRQIIALKLFLLQRHATVLMLDDLTAEPRGFDLESTVHGVILLEQRERAFGSVRRSMRVIKMRGADFQSGWHDFAIIKEEILVFPSLIADEHHKKFNQEPISSNVPELDELLGGGLGRGNSVLVLGPSGVGKSSLALQYANAVAKRNERTAYFSFDESSETLLERASGLSMSISDAIKRDFVYWERINPSRISPGEFIWKVRRQVEDNGVTIVVIDSLNSYLETMHEEQALMLQMHELLSYLSNMGVLALIIVGQSGVLEDVRDPMDVSFITDTVILLRFYEADGEVHKAISVVKKRPGRHESTIREFMLADTGVRVGPRLRDFEGVLSGTPRFIGTAARDNNSE
ncbi:circadian clock protein KaiC [Paucimonas lemoignei]|uniref:non-specific serine/threonine protein kinase n=1 Tax=Paucimonas lemoignei TaxID=29443 RepID=A0A4R3HV30_PAULE|nr:ATPase domain-containing protein [Paucimonas lemoignei]TCS36363.1 circadian clock protein KaiC [Paucimonas lemoignei]